jgi:23S rRNA pseudouridine1911/1915/1917 synthase
MKKRIFRRWANDPASLRDLLAARLGISPTEAVELIERGAVYVGRERAEYPLGNVGVAEQLTVHMSPLMIAPPVVTVYRDEDLAIIDKPPGLPSQAEPAQRAFCLEAAATRDLGPDARLMHRLDKDASGLVLVALRPTAYAPLQRAMTEHAIERRYLAIALGSLTGDGTIRKRIGRHPRDQRLRAALAEDATAGDPACTHFRALAHATFGGDPISAVELRLETGRTHQIRVHLSSLDHPIVGDEAYDGPPFDRLCLHAYALELTQPRTNRPIRVSTHVPDSFAALVPGLTRPFS